MAVQQFTDLPGAFFSRKVHAATSCSWTLVRCIWTCWVLWSTWMRFIWTSTPSWAGNLLGNLLCAVARLLDGPLGGGLGGLLDNLLHAINDLLDDILSSRARRSRRGLGPRRSAAFDSCVG